MTTTRYELDTLIEDLTVLGPDDLAIVQVAEGINQDKAEELLRHIPEAFQGRILLLVGYEQVLTVEEATLEVARAHVRHEQGRGPRPIRDSPQA